ncbi:hypothetical protein Y1Q_0001089 [Alligator mississippiensis]|uniref:Reverse transcriptase domain-containing protein n=1 Tax=Alligator mississippiensis TaxID=8496 RepID=A0A151NEH9_ALLMI|nr:hypothetical protein Y1Q_0001089 [Alligator mississippiensis]
MKLLKNHQKGCAEFQCMPTTWKKATMVLIHKKGDSSLCTPSRSCTPAAWQPMSLTGNLSQKGFMSMEGCYEHNFTLDNAQRIRKQCTVAWLDIYKAFSSIPHCHTLGTLCKLSLLDSVNLVWELYNGCTTPACVTYRETDEIPI